MRPLIWVPLSSTAQWSEALLTCLPEFRFQSQWTSCLYFQQIHKIYVALLNPDFFSFTQPHNYSKWISQCAGRAPNATFKPSPLRKQTIIWSVIRSSWAAAARLTCLCWGNIGAGIIIGGITHYCETVILHRGTGNPITGNLPAQLRQLISSRIAAEWGQKKRRYEAPEKSQVTECRSL